VLAHMGNDRDELWWPGTVLHAHKNGCADVQYDHGVVELKKPLARIRPIDRP